MNNKILYAIVISTTMCLSGCSMLGGTSTGKLVSANSSSTSSSGTTDVLGSALSSLATASTGDILGGILGDLLSGGTTQESFIGTWTYTNPKVVFESENMLAQLGSTIASSKIESSLNSQLKKMGFTAGKSTFTFNSDGTCAISLGGKSYTGTYTYDNNSHVMVIKGALGLASFSCTATINLGEMYMLFGADKLLSIANAASQLNSTLSSLLSSYNGLKVGWAMKKQ